MAAYSVKRIDEMEAVAAKSFKRARAELGVSAFGMQVIDMPPHTNRYPEHDHSDDGQEEVYVALHGSGEIEIEGERHRLDRDTMVRVGAGVTRKVWTADEALRVLIVGGTPGEVYEAPEVSKLGAPDPGVPDPPSVAQG
jgi:mannose-6-phosphate isomerase-like protein (cupin superfamily)